MPKLRDSHSPFSHALMAALKMKSVMFFGVLTLFAADAVACCYDNSQESSVSGSVSVSSDSVNDAAQNVSGAEDVSDESTDIDVSTSSQNNQDSVQDTGNLPDAGESDSGIGPTNSQPVWAQRSKRRNMLVRKWRSEFARMDVFDALTDQALDVDDIKFQLERIRADLPDRLNGEIAVLGRDLILLEEWMNDALDRRIPQKPTKRQRLFSLFRPSNLDATAIRNRLAMLESKRQMLVYGNNALQAMGLFVK
jgi:hypothetical protein